MAKLSPRDITKTRRWEVGKGLIALGNIAPTALLFKQAFSGESFNFWIAVLGLLLLAWLYSVALLVMKGGDD